MSPKLLLLLLCLFELTHSLGFGLGGGGGGCCCGGCGGGCGGGGGCCGGGYGRKKRSTDERDNQQSSSEGPACNNEHLREIMKENMGLAVSQSEIQITNALETESASYAVLCSNDTIAFKASPSMIHCLFIGPDHQCVAFSL